MLQAHAVKWFFSVLFLTLLASLTACSGSGGSAAPLPASVDDIQFFDRALNAEQVRQLNQIGICRP